MGLQSCVRLCYRTYTTPTGPRRPAGKTEESASTPAGESRVSRPASPPASPPLPPGAGIARSRPHGRRAVVIGVGVVLLAAMLAALALARPFVDAADAAVLGCAPSAPGRTLTDILEADTTLTAEWDLGALQGSEQVDDTLGFTDYDLDGIYEFSIDDDLDIDLDGADDVRMIAWVIGSTPEITPGTWRYDAVEEFVAHNYGYEVLRNGDGLDYAGSMTTTAGAPETSPTTIEFFLLSLTGTPTWDPGTIRLSASLDYTDGTSDEYAVTFDTTTADVSQSSAPSPWPAFIHASVFLDDALFDTLAVGLETQDPTFAWIPVSDLTAEVEILTVNSELRGDRIVVGATGPLAENAGGTTTTVGMPGRLGIVVSNHCDELPFRTWVGTGHAAAALGLPMPGALVADASLYGAGDADNDGVIEPETERSLYIDATITHPPTLLDAAIATDDADIDGNGLPDGLDLDNDNGADGIPDDRLPWQYVEVGHDGSTAPNVDLVFARQPTSPSDAPVFLTANVVALPKMLSFDRSGIPHTLDADGNGAADDLNGDGVIGAADVPVPSTFGALQACQKDWSTYPAACLAPPTVMGSLQATFDDEIPLPLSDGSLPVEVANFPPEASDLHATIPQHFDPKPADFVMVEATSATALVPGGGPFLAHEIDQIDARLRGFRSITWDVATETKVNVLSTGLGRFGAQFHDTNLVTNEQQTLWSVLADAPDAVGVVADTSPEQVDLDPLEVQWNTSGRTGAAVSVDTFDPTGDRRAIAASAWVGTMTGATNGFPNGGRVTVDLSGSSKLVAFRGPRVGGAPTRLDVGFTTSTAAQRQAHLATRGHVAAGIPDDFSFSWNEDSQNLTSAYLSTCAPGGSACPVKNLTATVVNTEWTGLAHDALGGVDMVPVPDADEQEFPDFTAYPETGGYYADWMHGVWLDDPASGAAGPPVVDLLDRWGVDLSLGEISAGRLTRFNVMDDDDDVAFGHTDFCLDGRTRTAELGLGLYEDEGSEDGATWFDGNLERALLDLHLTTTVVTPDPDAGGTVGDLTNDQLDLIDGKPDDFDLLDLQMHGCAGVEQEDEKTIIGRMRRGTEDDVAEVLRLGAQSIRNGGAGIPEPVDNGADVAFYVAKDDDETVFQGLDAAFRIPIPKILELRQPIYLRCGVGSRPFPACHDLPTYDTTTTTDVALELVTDIDAVLGDLDLEYLTEPVDGNVDTQQAECSPDRFGDECALRSVLHIDQVPGHLTLDGSLVSRLRDGFMDVDLTVENAAKDPVMDMIGIDFKYRDDYHPPRLGDESEDGPANEPIAWLELENVGKTLTIDGVVWAGRYGWSGDVYNTADCEGWTSPNQDDHIYPYGADPSTWTTEGPRPDSELRGAYLHGWLDLNPDNDQRPAERVELDVDNRVDDTGDYEHEPTGAFGAIWYDDPVRFPTKVGIDTAGDPSDGELWALAPALRQHVNIDGPFADGEICMDMDVPVHAEWEAASNLRVGVDAAKLTVSMLDAEVNAGADATLTFEERLSSSIFSNNTVTGAWVHELKTWYNPVLKNWFTGIEDQRMSVAFLDPNDLKLEVLLRDEFGVQGTFRNGWSATGTTDADRYYGEVLLQAFFHEDVEAVLSADAGIPDMLDAWTGLWNHVDEATNRITSWTYPRLDADAVFNVGPVGFDHVSTRNCAQDQVNAIGQTFTSGGAASDGTNFELGARWNNDRVEVFLIGKYDNDQVRFVRELYDGDPGQKTCTLHMEGSIEVDPETGRVEVVFDLDGTAKLAPTLQDWFAITDDTFVFDISGNGWIEGATPLDNIVGGIAGRELTLGGGATPSVNEDCVWYPGDGSRITPDDDDNDGATATHTYTFPGEYQVMQLCYDGSDPDHPDLREATVTVETLP